MSLDIILEDFSSGSTAGPSLSLPEANSGDTSTPNPATTHILRSRSVLVLIPEHATPGPGPGPLIATTWPGRPSRDVQLVMTPAIHVFQIFLFSRGCVSNHSKELEDRQPCLVVLSHGSNADNLRLLLLSSSCP